MSILLVGGLKHSGKSTLGRIIARESNAQFHDMDDLVLKEAGGTWQSLRKLYQNLGREEFCRLEEDAARNFIEWILPHLKGRSVVLSLGGGTVENTNAMAWLRNKGCQIYIRADRELLYSRIMAGGRPPFLSEEDPYGDFKDLYARRDPLWTDFATLIHDVDEAPPKINAQRLQMALEKQHAW